MSTSVLLFKSSKNAQGPTNNKNSESESDNREFSVTMVEEDEDECFSLSFFSVKDK